MRNIKFRVWNKEDKSMHIVITLHNPFHMDFCEYATGQSSDSVVSIQYENCKIMQLTGLKDRNGLEIYEGDIVKLSCTIRKLLAIIEWSDENHGFFAFIKDDEKRKEHNWNAGMHDCFRYMEIVGNIYENSDLLNCKEVKNDD